MANPYNPGYYPTDYNMQSIPQNNIGRPTYYSGSINNSQYYGQQNSLLGSPMQTTQSNPILSVGQYGQPIQQQQPFQNLDTNLYIVPVTCPEEAVAYKIPLDGSVTYFIDKAHGKIYSKQLNMNDGSALFKSYSVDNQPNQQQANNNIITNNESSETKQYVERNEFDKLATVVNQLLEREPLQSSVTTSNSTTETISKSNSKGGK